MATGVKSYLRHTSVRKIIAQNTKYLAIIICMVKRIQQPDSLPRKKARPPDRLLRSKKNAVYLYHLEQNQKIKILFMVVPFSRQECWLHVSVCWVTENALESKISRSKQEQCDMKNPVHYVGCSCSRKSTGTLKTNSVVSVGTKQYHNY